MMKLNILVPQEKKMSKNYLIKNFNSRKNAKTVKK